MERQPNIIYEGNKIIVPLFWWELIRLSDRRRFPVYLGSLLLAPAPIHQPPARRLS
jgi:hypothetical protein